MEYGAIDAASEITEFRKVEKLYQRHCEQQIKYNKEGKPRGGKLIVKPTDFTSVLDVDNAAQVEQLGDEISRHSLPPCCSSVSEAAQLFLFRSHPGFLLIRNALSPSTQQHYIRDCISVLPDPPAVTNLNREWGPISGIWQASRQGLYLYHDPDTKTNTWQTTAESNNNDKPAPSAKKLLHKVRWVSIGPPFDWTKREYILDSPQRPVPDYLVQLSNTITTAAMQVWQSSSTCSTIQTSSSSPYAFDAALVNFYYENSTLGGHLDDAELDMDHPIVSISLGCPGVLLMGGETRDTRPITPVWLRSGDVVIFAGPARRCFHGVPRVMPSMSDGGLGHGLSSGGLDKDMMEFIQSCRINISVRGTAVAAAAHS